MSNRRQPGRDNLDQDNSQIQESQDSISKSAPVRKRRRWPWILLILLVLFYFLPTIILQTPLKQKAIDWATADFKGTIVADSISSGWFSPTKISGLTVRDEEGETLATVDTISTTKSLYGLATGGSELGAIDVGSPKIYLQLRPDGSNLEDAIAEYMKPSDEPATDLPHVQLNVSGAEVHIATTTDPQTWLVSDLNINSKRNLPIENPSPSGLSGGSRTATSTGSLQRSRSGRRQRGLSVYRWRQRHCREPGPDDRITVRVGRA